MEGNFTSVLQGAAWDCQVRPESCHSGVLCSDFAVSAAEANICERRLRLVRSFKRIFNYWKQIVGIDTLEGKFQSQAHFSLGVVQRSQCFHLLYMHLSKMAVYAQLLLLCAYHPPPLCGPIGISNWVCADWLSPHMIKGVLLISLPFQAPSRKQMLSAFSPFNFVLVEWQKCGTR